MRGTLSRETRVTKGQPTHPSEPVPDGIPMRSAFLRFNEAGALAPRKGSSAIAELAAALTRAATSAG